MFTRLWDGIRFINQTDYSLSSDQCDYKDNEMEFVDIVLIILLISFVSFSPSIIDEVENETNKSHVRDSNVLVFV